MFENRRYRMIAGRLEKAWHGRDDDGWVKTKAEAYAAVAPQKAPLVMPAKAEPAEIVTGIVEEPPKRGPGRPRKEPPAEDEADA